MSIDQKFVFSASLLPPEFCSLFNKDEQKKMENMTPNSKHL